MPATEGAEAVVQRHGAARALHRLGEAVAEALELLLPLADVRGEAGTGVVERVHDGERRSAGEAARGELRAEELQELLVLVELREPGLDGVLEGKVEGLGREVADDVHAVSAPEGGDALLRRDAREAVADAGVALDLARLNVRVGILRLDHKLHALDGSRQRLRDRAGHTAGGEVDREVLGCLCLAHVCKLV